MRNLYIHTVSLIMIMVLPLTGCNANRSATPVRVSVFDMTLDGLRARKITSEHFEIYSTLEDRSFEDVLPAFMEAAYQQYQQMLPSVERDQHKPFKVYIFGLRRQWRNYVRRHYSDRFEVYDRIRSGGFTEGDTSVSFYTSRSNTLATLAHEGWHQYVGTRFRGPIPPWLNEGIACYFEAIDYSSDQPRFTPQKNTLRINSLRAALQHGSLFTIRELVNTHAGDVIQHTGTRQTHTYYAQAWALITFLRHGVNKMYAKDFERLLADIADGSYRIRLSAAGLADARITQRTLGAATFESYFGFIPESITDDYHDHLLHIVGFDNP